MAYESDFDDDGESTCASFTLTTSITVSAEIKAIDGQPEKHVIEFRKQDGDVGLYAEHVRKMRRYLRGVE